ncbi:unnamed protein product [Vitrella brassicaformis CCMP3155]|uniref:Uncharacterized protein n=1 Tax=Vitrella brassicaformis (strain CCMP3155) TaxID=1169540 RepID=A0A0G4ESE1_VITBC|nr:unnamed protein product [Vitrella brassicaformis CCMP3155]|eukprot:CEM00837.1 unnamed protein product [Vitrella brassicaformis CCMP3155]
MPPIRTPAAAALRQTLMSRGIEVPDVYKDSREAYVLKYQRLRREHPAECKAFLESVRGTQEGKDMKNMNYDVESYSRQKAAATPTTACPSSKKILVVPVSTWGEGDNGWYASALTQWDIAHWERDGRLWMVTWAPPKEACCCVELGRGAIRGMRMAGAHLAAAGDEIARVTKSLFH